MAIHDVGLDRSVRRQLSQGERPEKIVFMSTRHHLWLPFVVGAFVAFLVLAIALGFDLWTSRLGLAVAAAAVASMAATEYRVLVETNRGLVLLRAGRVRRRATAVMKRLPKGETVEALASNLVTADYRLGGVTYTVAYRFRSAMDALAHA